MSYQYQEVVDAGPGWTKVRLADGSIVTMQGARNWRNNNPGNIEYGDFAKSHGAIGTDGRFAVFPTYDDGRGAKASLLFDSPNYRDKTIEAAIARYAPPSENNSASYAAQVAAAAGVPVSTPLGSLAPPQRDAMLSAMERVEGFKPGKVIGGDGSQYPSDSDPSLRFGYTHTPASAGGGIGSDATVDARVPLPPFGGIGSDATIGMRGPQLQLPPQQPAPHIGGIGSDHAASMSNGVNVPVPESSFGSLAPLMMAMGSMGGGAPEAPQIAPMAPKPQGPTLSDVLMALRARQGIA